MPTGHFFGLCSRATCPSAGPGILVVRDVRWNRKKDVLFGLIFS